MALFDHYEEKPSRLWDGVDRVGCRTMVVEFWTMCGFLLTVNLVVSILEVWVK